MYRSSVITFALLVILGFAAVCSGTPVETGMRHEASHEMHHEDMDNASQAAEKPMAEKPMAEKPMTEKPMTEKPTHDHSSHSKEVQEASPEATDNEEENVVPAVEGNEIETATEEPEASPEASAVCIATDMLADFAAHELVFEKHVLAHVLCDTAGSCATNGHIVNYKGKGMMMASYCDIVGCEAKIMEVNSPKYSRGLKVASKSEDMHFTAFAARYETRGEEAVLSTAVRMGL